jgi:uroporphyrinogen III methyltransferase / synthase
MSARVSSYSKGSMAEDVTARLGKVYLVGAGPGEPELITLRGLRLIETADVILYDNLAPTALLSRAPTAAETLYVGKKRARHAYTQEQINQLLIDYARRGKRVVRLKGGDPYLFGRGGEEAQALHLAGIPFEVIPGVTSALGLAAYAGIPLTHRDTTSAVTFVTGHEVERIDWTKIGTAETLVIFMGVTLFGEISRRLIEAGRVPSTPAAAVRWASRGDQRSVVGTLENLAARMREAALKPPATIVVGEVVALRADLNWFEKLPLFQTRIVVTRAREQAGQLSEMLREQGACVIELPTIEIRPPADWGPLDSAVAGIEGYDWILFTSANGVRFFVERLDASRKDLRHLRGKVCAIGPATAERLRSLHIKVDLMPEEYVAESVLKAFESHDLAGKRLLLPRAKVARDLIPVELARRGATVDVVPAYQTVVPEESAKLAAEIFERGAKPHWITFTSSSTVRNFARLCRIESLNGVKIASIGPVTSRTVQEFGLQVDLEPQRYTMDGLVEALVRRQLEEAVPDPSTAR